MGVNTKQYTQPQHFDGSRLSLGLRIHLRWALVRFAQQNVDNDICDAAL